MTLLSDIARNMLTEALNSEYGIQVLVEADPVMICPTLRAKQVLYRFKQEDKDFENLIIKFGDDPDRHLKIIKKSEIEGGAALDEALDIDPEESNV